MLQTVQELMKNKVWLQIHLAMLNGWDKGEIKFDDLNIFCFWKIKLF